MPVTNDILVKLLDREYEKREAWQMASAMWEGRAKSAEESVLQLITRNTNLVLENEEYRNSHSTHNTEVEGMRRTLRHLARMDRASWPARLESSRKISIIKEVRERFYLNLKEAKEVVDRWYSDQEYDDRVKENNGDELQAALDLANELDREDEPVTGPES